MATRNSLLLAVLFILLTTDVSAMVSCHCFKDRSYVPETPASADPYILATTRNSLVAAAMGVSKSNVVKERMVGKTETELWLEGYLPTLPKEQQKHLNSRASAGGAPLARLMAEGVLAKAFKANANELKLLGEAGADIAATTLSLIISRENGEPPSAIYRKVAGKETSWGTLLSTEDIAPEELSELIFDALE